MKKTFQHIQILALSAVLLATLLTSCSKGKPDNPGGTPQSAIPSQFAGDWSTSSVGLMTYWDNGEYVGSDGDLIISVSFTTDGTAELYGYYNNAYAGTTFYRYLCTATYKEEADGSSTITMYPYDGEQMIGGGPKMGIGSNSLYPNRTFVLKNCTTYTQNGKTYISYYELNPDGQMPDEPLALEKLNN